MIHRQEDDFHELVTRETPTWNIDDPAQDPHRLALSAIKFHHGEVALSFWRGRKINPGEAEDSSSPWNWGPRELGI